MQYPYPQNNKIPDLSCLFSVWRILPFDNGEVRIYTTLMEKILKCYSVKVDGDGFVEEIVKDNSGNIVLSGFCEIHSHGAMGFDISVATQEALDAVSKYYLENGITAFSPTFVATPLDVLDSQLDRLYSLKQNYARMLPAHLEGPFISLEHKGAQPAENILPEYTDEHAWFFEKHHGHIGIVTLCPAVKGVEKLVKLLVSLGIKVQGGHDNARYPDIAKCIDAGLDGVTHIFCGCSTSVRGKTDFEKLLGLTETGLYRDDLAVEVIADGKHLSKELVDFIFKCKPLDKIIYVSDSLSPAGMPTGEYKLGDHDILNAGDVAYLKDMSSIAGSVTNLYRMLHLSLDYGYPLEKLLHCVSLNPREYMGLPTSIKVGDKADFVVLDGEGNLKKTVLGTKEICH